MRKGIRDSLCYLYHNPSVSYTLFVIAAQKNESELSEAKKVRRKSTEVETEEGNSVLAAWTEQIANLMATLDTKSNSSGSQRNRGQQNIVNGAGNQGLSNNNRKGDHQNSSSNNLQNPTPVHWRAEIQVH